MAEKVKEFKGGPGGRCRGPKSKVENPGIIMKRLFGMLFKSYGVALIIVAICIVLSVVANVQGTWFTKNLIDIYIIPMVKTLNAGGAPNYTPLMHAMVKVAIFYGIGALSTFAYNRIMVYVTQGTLRNLRNQMFEHMEKLPIKYFDTHSHGDIMSMYTNDIDTLRQLISQSMPQFLNSGITIVTVFASMVALSIPLTIVTLIMIAIMLYATKKSAGLSGKYFIKQQKDIGKVNGFIEEMMEGQKVVKVFNHEEININDFVEINNQLYNSANNANKFANILGPINAQLGNVSYALTAIVGGFLAINKVTFLGNALTLGGLVSFLTFNKNFSMPINQISQQVNAIVMALAGADRIFKLLDETPETDDGYVTLVNAKYEGDKLVETKEKTGIWAWKHIHKADGTLEYKQLTGDVVFDDVDFGYNDDKIVLHNVDLFATPGQKIAFVGSTGAGKTTITNLINRFYDIQDRKNQI